ncbi:MAG: DUF58 domain-containing protein [Chitinispirillaceae bacterium]|nr:DUF58 domain-containing protein [Chitinispirillaceae bacterium]
MIPKELIQKVRRIEITTKRVVDSLLSGGYHSAFKGKGMEFSEVRGYVDGDDIRSIDWNVTARMGTPYVKKHIEEREMTVMLMVDASASGSFGTVNKFKGEIGVELCALLAFSAIKNNDRVGLIIFSSEVERYIPPQKGRNHVLYVIRELLYFKPQHPGTDIDKALQFLNRVQTKKAVVFLVSDFMAPPFETALRISGRRHDLIACPVSDPREMEFPDVGLVELEDAESGATMLVDSGSAAFRNHYAKTMRARREKASSIFKSNGIDEIPISTGSEYVDELVKFFRKRERMLGR